MRANRFTDLALDFGLILARVSHLKRNIYVLVTSNHYYYHVAITFYSHTKLIQI